MILETHIIAHWDANTLPRYVGVARAFHNGQTVVVYLDAPYWMTRARVGQALADAVLLTRTADPQEIKT